MIQEKPQDHLLAEKAREEKESVTGKATVKVGNQEYKLDVEIKGSAEWSYEDKNNRGNAVVSFTISGAMILRSHNKEWTLEEYESDNMQFQFRVFGQIFDKKSKKCNPLQSEGTVSGTATITKNKVSIYYKDKPSLGGRGKEGGVILAFEPPALTGKGRHQDKCNEFVEVPWAAGVMQVLVDEAAAIASDQTVFTGSRSYGLKDFPIALDEPAMFLPFFTDAWVKSPADPAYVTPNGSNIKLDWTLTKAKEE